jgi:hypothetical protein
LHQAHHGAETAAVDELNLIELQDDFSVFVDSVGNAGVQGKDFVAGDDAAVTLNYEDFANWTTLDAKLQPGS